MSKGKIELWEKIKSRLGATDSSIVGIDLAKEGTGYTVFKCPTCMKFQELVSPDYLCRICGQKAVTNAVMGYR